MDADMDVDMERIALAINALGDFLGMRDIAELTPECMAKHCGCGCADVMVLFGGSILAGGDVLAQAMRAGVARRYAIVGGEGHTTLELRRRVADMFGDVDTRGMPEAQVFAAYMKRRHGLDIDLMECASTNCGNNISNMLAMLEAQGVPHDSVILTQDASMQRRMDAGLRLRAPGTRIINFAAYRARVAVRGGRLEYESEIRGMWPIERYVSLLISEIPRLTDDEQGYGPRGRGFIAHVDVSGEVRAAFELLRDADIASLRAEDARYAGN